MRTAHAGQSSATSATRLQHGLHKTCTGNPNQNNLLAWNLTPRHDSLGGVALHGSVNKQLHGVKAGELHQARAQNGASACNTLVPPLLPVSARNCCDRRKNVITAGEYVRVMVETAQLRDAWGPVAGKIFGCALPETPDQQAHCRYVALRLEQLLHSSMREAGISTERNLWAKMHTRSNYIVH